MRNGRSNGLVGTRPLSIPIFRIFVSTRHRLGILSDHIPADMRGLKSEKATAELSQKLRTVTALTQNLTDPRLYTNGSWFYLVISVNLLG